MKRILALCAILLSLAGFSVVATSRAQAATPSANQKIVAGAEAIVRAHIMYRYGGASPSQGFDCSGLAQYVYYHYADRGIPRTADEQFRAFHAEPLSHAQQGDLVFFHDTSNPDSYVYHVGIIIGGGMMIDAESTGHPVLIQSYHWGYRTYGTATHTP